MAKTPNTSTKSRRCPKNTRRPQKEKYWRTKEQIHGLGTRFKEWCKTAANDTKSRRTVAERFWIDNDLHPDTVRTWFKKYPDFKHDYDIGMMYLGCKKLEGIHHKELEPSKTAFLLHNYLPSWKKAEKYHADMKNIKDAVAQLLGVEFDVPELERDK